MLDSYVKVSTKSFRQINLLDAPVNFCRGRSVACYYEFLPKTKGITSVDYVYELVELGMQANGMYYYLLNGVIPVCMDEDNFWKYIDYEVNRK